MAEDNTPPAQSDKGGKMATSPASSAGQEGAKEGTQSQERLLGKFDSTEALTESYKKLEEKLGQQGTELDSLRNYYRDSYRVLEAVAADPSTLMQVQARLGVAPQTGQAQAGDEAGRLRRIVQQEVAPLKEARRAEVIQSFEEKFGIAELPAEERREVRTKLGAEITSLSGSWPSDERLATALEKAWQLVNVEKLKDEGKLEGKAEAFRAAAGRIGATPSKSKREKTVELTPEQKRVADKAEVSYEDYAKQLQEIQAS